MTRRRLVLYLLLNILISALVTGAVLSVYDRFMRPVCPSGIGAETGVMITSITGTGTLANEVVTLKNSGSKSVILTGWTLLDSSGTAYLLPQLTLYPGGTIQVHSSSGSDSVTDLFWGNTSPIWESGELAVLYDTQGLARTFFRIP